MRNIYYFNVNYRCNNNCLFCFSHNTFEHKLQDLEYRNVENAIKEHRIGVGDRVIINGGEPTLHSDILSILKVFYYSGAEIVLYSNGRKLSDYEFANNVLQYVNRVVIPIHGNHMIHNEITQSNESYKETLQALNNFCALNAINKLEMKFIVNQRMIESDFDIRAFLETNLLSDANVVITGTVRTKTSLLNGITIPQEEILGKYISQQLLKLMNGMRQIKLMDCKFCFLSNEMLQRIEAMEAYNTDISYKYFFFDSNVPNGRIMEYNSMRKCRGCKYIEACRSIMDACIVFAFNGDKKTVVLE